MKLDEQERSDMLSNMNVHRLLLKLSAPAIAAMVFNALYNLIDTFFVAQGVGQVAIGALSIAYPIHMIILSTGLMIGIGSASIFSRAYGRDDKRTMRRVVNMALLANVTLSVSISILSYVFIDDLLQLFGAVDENIDYARDYLSIILIALVPFSLSISFNHLTRAEGRARVAMISLMIGAILNILLDPILIFDWGLGMGVRGAATATAIAKTASFGYILVMALRPESSLRLSLASIFDVDFSMVREIFTVGFPSFVRVALGGVLVVIVNNLIGLHAPAGQAAMFISIYGVINRLMRFTLMPGFGIVQGLIPIVGFNYGAQFFRRLYTSILFAVKIMLGYFVFIFVMVMFFAEPLFTLFSPEADPAFIASGAFAFRIVAAGFSLAVFPFMISSIYQAMGYPFRAFIIAVARRFLLFVPISLLLTTLFGVTGIWWTFFATDVLVGVGSLIVFGYEMRTIKRRFHEDRHPQAAT